MHPFQALINRHTIGERTFSEYKINLTFINNGSSNSEDLKVKFTDEEGFELSETFNVKVGVEEIVTINWSTSLFKNHNFIFHFKPVNLDSPWYQHNSGTKKYTLIMTDDEEGGLIPGFEILTVALALIIVTLYIMKKKK